MFGDFRVLNAFDRFLQTSSWSENRNSTNGTPLLDSPSEEESWMTSDFATKLRWDETRSGYKKK